ncbi:MAG: 1-acyl-sn-glycerol-3-phosphate acyltransferase [Planctomycetes bacterium]|nr:1-acyl-sn-glycerol-3-phosphate acyltransferase [Planctomycetota bacterium]
MREVIISILAAFNRAYCRTIFRVAAATRIPLPPSGPAVIVANHTSGADPFLLSAVVNRRIRFLMAAEYYEMPILNRFFRLVGAIPVQRDGRDVPGTRLAIEALRRGACVGIFPRGGIGLEGPLKRGAAMLAVHAHAPIVPAHIAGGPPGFQVFGAFLRPARVRIAFGEPIRIERDRTASRDAIDRATHGIDEALRALSSPEVRGASSSPPSRSASAGAMRRTPRGAGP